MSAFVHICAEYFLLYIFPCTGIACGLFQRYGGGMLEHRKVLITCALWNSEEYIREELDSVVAQTFTNWEMILANDSANEATMEIIHEFMDKDPRFLLMGNDTGRHGSHGNNRNLIINADTKNDSYDYYAYLDNDDIWKPNKLETYVRKAEEIRREKGEDTPICFTCNMETIDTYGNLLSPDFASVYPYEIKHPMDAFLTHRVFGCNLFIDKRVHAALRQIMSDPDFPETISYDNLTYQVAAALDADLSFIPQVLMSYRRHTYNTTKGAVYRITPAYFLKSLAGIGTIIHNNAFIARDSIDSIDYILQLDLPEQKRKELLEVREGLEKGGIPAMRMWHKYRISCGNRIRTIENWLSLCLGLERKYMDRNKYPEL